MAFFLVTFAFPVAAAFALGWLCRGVWEDDRPEREAVRASRNAR